MKAAVEFHLFQVRMTTIYAYIYADVGKGMEHKEPLGTAGKVVNQHSTVGDSGTHWRADTRTFVQSGFPSCIWTEGNGVHMYKDACLCMLTAALRMWSQPACPSTDSG